MFKTAIINVFVPIGNGVSAKELIGRIKPTSSKLSSGELIVRVFEYNDPKPIIPIAKLGDIIVVNPDVFPNGRYYSPEKYKKMVRKVFSAAECDIQDIGSIDREESKEHIRAGFNQIFWHNSQSSESKFINYSSRSLFNNARDRGAPADICRDTATHVGTVAIKFVRDVIPIQDQPPSADKQQIPLEAADDHTFYIPIVNGAATNLL